MESNHFDPRFYLPPVLTIEQARQFLGYGRSRFYYLCRTGQIPGVVRHGRTFRILRDTFLDGLVSKSKGAEKAASDMLGD